MAVSSTQASSFVSSSSFTPKTGGPSLADVAAGRAVLHRSDATGPSSKGAAVQEVQLLLQKAGFAIEADGEYGKATKAAVEAFQRRNGLVVDGKVGKNTLARLRSDAGDGVELPRGGQSPIAGLFNASTPEAAVRARFDETVPTPLLGTTQTQRIAELARFSQVDGNDKSTLDLQTCGVHSVLAGLYVKNPGGLIDIARNLTQPGKKNDLDRWAKTAGLDPKQVRKDFEAIAKTGKISPVQMSEMSSVLLADMHERAKKASGKDVRGTNDAELQMLTRDILTKEMGVQVPPMTLMLRDVEAGGKHFGHWTMRMDIATFADVKEGARNDAVLTFDPFPTTAGTARTGVALNKQGAELLTQGRPEQEITVRNDGSMTGVK